MNRETHYAALKVRYAIAVSYAMQQGTAAAMHGISYECLAAAEYNDLLREAQDAARTAELLAASAAKPLSKKQQKLAKHRAAH